MCSVGHNLLLEGPETSTEEALRLLRPHLPEPVASMRVGSTLPVQATDRGTLILEDVAALTRGEQTLLLEWLERSEPHPQIVSTTRQALFPLVPLGLFDARLYYYLNTVLLHVD